MVIELPEWMGIGGLPWLFTAVQMHLHWGSGGPSHGGSEHTINGLSADAEVRFNSSVISVNLLDCMQEHKQKV